MECGPIKADSLLCSLSESAISHGGFEAKDVSVSVGLKELEVGLRDRETTKLGGLSTVLDTKQAAFLQLNGRSTVEVDENGVFISIPTFRQGDEASPINQRKPRKAGFKTSRRGLRIAATSVRMRVA